MTHQPVLIRNVSVSFPPKICFEDFSATLLPGQRIGIMGCNGSGKSTLLRVLQQLCLKQGIATGYIPQMIEEHTTSSGGERFQKALTAALSCHPDVLLLDEPTNHLDRTHRQGLMRMLKRYQGTLIVISHDVELLRQQVQILWHIEDKRVMVFTGNYDDYAREISIRRGSIEKEMAALQRQQKEAHQALMKEQKRASTSREKGEKSIINRKWPTIVSSAKVRRSEETSGQKKIKIRERREELSNQLAGLRLPEVVTPTFSLKPSDVDNRLLVYIRDGSVGYAEPILQNLHISVTGTTRIAITGDNGSGKSTLVRGILQDPTVNRTGVWQTPPREAIGYLDQHYDTLDSKATVLETIGAIVPHWSHAEMRKHLNDFLFRKNDEVNALTSTLSGGEKARLVLAKIAAQSPRLLILDEMTNNLDVQTRAHVIEVLQQYPGALMVISHDEDFLGRLQLERLDVQDLGPVLTSM